MKHLGRVFGAFLLMASPLAFQRPAFADDAKDTLLFHWEVKLDSGLTSIVSQAGELTRLAQKGGDAFAISATKEKEGDAAVTFRILTVKNVEGAGEILKQVEKFTLLPGASYTTAWKPSLAFHLTKVTSAGSDGEAPKSAALVTWEVSSPGRADVRFVSVNGETASLQGINGETWQITPSVRDGGAVDFSLSKGGSSPNRFTLRVGALHPAEDSGLTFKLTSVRQSS